MPTARFKDLCLDAVHHQALADWWCTALGYRRTRAVEDAGAPVPIADPAGSGPLIWINPVAEPKAGKNRVHFDVEGNTDALLAAGARLVRRRDDEIAWDVLADPEGNEFCCFPPKG